MIEASLCGSIFPLTCQSTISAICWNTFNWRLWKSFFIKQNKVLMRNQNHERLKKYMQRYHSRNIRFGVWQFPLKQQTIFLAKSLFFLYKASIKLNKICETLYFDSGYIFSISHTEAIISAFGNHDFFVHIFIYDLILYTNIYT